jgi:Peptidase family M28
MGVHRIRSYRGSFGVLIFVAGCGSSNPVVPPLGPPPVAAPATTAIAAVATPKTPLGLCDLAKDLDPLPVRSFEATSNEVSPDNLATTINVLANQALHGRGAGSVDNRRAARWIADRFAAMGLSPAPGAEHCVPFERRGIRDQNVVAYLARDVRPDAPVILVGAHYDAQGEDGASVFPGADDNASGVAALLEIARISAIRGTGPAMLFVAFGAEESGLLGAKAYVDTPIIPLSRVALMINLDMVGRPLLDGSPMRLLIPRADETIGYVIGHVDAPKTTNILKRAAEREERPIIGIPEIVLKRLGFASDSVPFSPHVPTIFLSTGDHADYHKPTDTEEKIDYEQLSRAIRLTLAIVDEVTSSVTP